MSQRWRCWDNFECCRGAWERPKTAQYSNVLPGYLDFTTDGHFLVENKAMVLSHHVTISINQERVEVTNHRGYHAVYVSKCLFVLDGGPIEHLG